MKDLVGEIMDYESGAMDHQETVEFFQELYDDGTVYKLQGHYGRVLEQLIEGGHIKRKV
jgi:hypothetical protein